MRTSKDVSQRSMASRTYRVLLNGLCAYLVGIFFFCLLHDTTWTWRAYGVRDHQPFFFTLHRAPTASQHVYVGSSITKYCSRAGHMCRTGILFLLVAFDSIHTAVGYTYTAFVLRRSKKGTIKYTKSNATEQCLKGKPNIND